MELIIHRMLTPRGASVRYAGLNPDNGEEVEVEFWGAWQAPEAEAVFGPALETQDDGRFGWWPLADVQAAIQNVARAAAATSAAWALTQNAAARADAARQAEADFARAAGLPVVSCRRCGLDWAGEGYGHQGVYCAPCHAALGGAVERANARLAEAAQAPGNAHMRAGRRSSEGIRHGAADSGLGGVQGGSWD